MTKTLTEQWREGTLPDGLYYLDDDTQEMKVEIKDGRMYIDGIVVNRHSYGDDIDLMVIKGSVPSYDHFSQLVKKVERLEEQIEEANAIIDLYFPKDKKINVVCVKPINDYREKWGVE